MFSSIRTITSEVVSDLFRFCFPQPCAICGNRMAKGEHVLCTACLSQLPRTNYHWLQDGRMEKLFWGQIDIVRATAMFFYSGEKVRNIIHNVKYRNMPQAGRYLGKVFAEEIEQSGFFEDIDYIVPIPLHFYRRLRRGYNQSQWIAEGVSEATGIRIAHGVVKRIKDNKTQTRLNAAERKLNVSDIFKLRDAKKIEGKHILLVDDVMTTGSTLLSCAKEMSKAGGVKISILTLAFAKGNDVPDSEELYPFF